MQKKIPMRMCVSCREMKPKRELIRIVCKKLPDDETVIGVDLTGKASGRGAYICCDTECLQRAKKSRALERALSTSIDEEIYAEIGYSIERSVAHGKK